MEPPGVQEEDENDAKLAEIFAEIGMDMMLIL
jgi:hypothetical protein